MAKAPRPGSVSGPDVAKTKPGGILRITVQGTTLDLSKAIPFKERFVVRAATGLPLSAFWSGEFKIDEDSVKILWWLARRSNGEPRLSFEEVDDQWPGGMTPDDLEVEEIDDDEESDDPEVSGPA